VVSVLIKTPTNISMSKRRHRGSTNSHSRFNLVEAFVRPRQASRFFHPRGERLESRYLLSIGPLPESIVKHTPYLQLGDAPLVGFDGGTDQIEVLWQTIAGRGGGTDDAFTAEYRAAGAPTWIDAGEISTIETGVASRINYSVAITSLQYDADYEYRVIHERGGQEVTTYQDTFHTRLPAGDTTAFTFAAYGDSATGTAVNFRRVQSRINQIDESEGVAFSLLLGDQAYSSGTHAQFDARLDPAINPELTEYIADHVDYYAMGNHDAATQSGRPSRENYSVPIPELGVTSPVAPPRSETPEENYSFDYGNVHFATFDSNSLSSSGRLNNQLNWLVADMNASDAQWKIVWVHHPVAGSPDKPEKPSNNYYKQVVSRLRDAGVDVFLSGHSHTYSRTYPLLGQTGLGIATFVADTDSDYAKGDGLIQVVSGVGGASLRPGTFNQFPFDAVGFSTSTTPRVEFGFSKVEVTPDQLTISYVAADDGAVIDSFTFSVVPDTTPPVVETVVPQDNGPGDLDSAGDAMLVPTVQSNFQFQITDLSDGVDEATIVSETVAVAKDGEPLSESVDYTFSYDAVSDMIRLGATSGSFDDGAYVITLSGGAAKIADLGNNAMSTTTFTIVIDTTIPVPQRLTFQHGVDGYTGTVDTFLQEHRRSSRNNALATLLKVGTDDPVGSGNDVQTLLRFDNLFGDGDGQIPDGITVVTATLQLQVTNPGDAMQLHRMLQDWSDSARWRNSGAGIQANDDEAVSTANADSGLVSSGRLSIDVKSSLEAWVSDPAANLGWVLLSTVGDGVIFDSAEGTTPPRLVVEFYVNSAPQAIDDSYEMDENSTLSVPVVGDANMNGTVGLADFLILADHFGQVGGFGQGDFDGNGIVQFADFLLLSANFGQTVGPRVLSNDSDTDDDPLTAVLDVGPSHAQSFQLNSDGFFRYTPSANFNGVDSFTYRADDGSTQSNVATVFITINSVHPAPIAVDRLFAELESVLDDERQQPAESQL